MNSEWLNKEKLEQLSSEIGEENLPILLAIFLGELDDYQSGLKERQDSAQVDYLSEISHALKSSADSFGADKLTVLARQLDAKSKQGVLNNSGEDVNMMLDMLFHTHQHYFDQLS